MDVCGWIHGLTHNSEPVLEICFPLYRLSGLVIPAVFVSPSLVSPTLGESFFANIFAGLRLSRYDGQ